jgi:hypothetical protein
MATTLDLLAAFRQDIDRRGHFLTGRRGAMKLNPSVRIYMRSLRWYGQLAKQLNLGGY